MIHLVISESSGLARNAGSAQSSLDTGFAACQGDAAAVVCSARQMTGSTSMAICL